VFKHVTSTSPDDLKIAVDHGEGGAIIRLHGRLGIDSSPALRDQLLAMLQAEPPESILVDLTEVVYIDASGVATLLEGLKIAHHRRTKFCIDGLQGRVARLFEATGLISLFEANGCIRAPSGSKVN
jgi:anti-sigma B factor antagonist